MNQSHANAHCSMNPSLCYACNQKLLNTLDDPNRYGQEAGKEWREGQQDTCFVGNGLWLQSYPTSGKFLLRRGPLEVDSQSQVGQRAGRESKCRGGVEGEQEKAGAEDVEISNKAPVIIEPVRGQSQHFRTKLGNGKAPQSGRAEEQRVCSQGRLRVERGMSGRGFTSEWYQRQMGSV
jgi:hypothetical protein